MPYLYIVVSGVLAGVLFSGFLANVSHKRVREILTMLLAYFAAIYTLPSIGNYTLLGGLEILVSLGVVLMAFASIRGSHLWLAMGFFSHGLWDVLHAQWIPMALPVWYSPLCLGVNWAIAVFVVLYFAEDERGYQITTASA